ncbi:uncharacterized protein LOC109532726 [Dendroctonus ponderosae]|uniref:uncharacterized protein LOC109532726 n=1 Tax=Dendroctonus ponderosae TaxID=77166 RepID=UPI0020363206|nr:uncharacterized protein LOC109532726 [Dendroctonus ponderosae]XP_019753297.2 uncharacterized protein LOC109532726 [Dendroctonus ponderosae]XP_019753298.2 uncharacterized protein LOC109532726 [Dendroctonus ponderosae]XP_019753299.2 uncharacterized protein LOC109532726 [Dendroctonus ponderosae]
MAIYCSRSASLYPSTLLILALKKLQPCPCFHLHQPAKDEPGVLDEFTSQLVQRQRSKWQYRTSLAQSNIKQISIERVGNSIKILHDVNALLQNAINSSDSAAIGDLTNHCIKYDKAPFLPVLIEALSVCSRCGDKDAIVKIVQLFEKTRPEFLHEYSNFEHYKAEAIWIKGDITKSLTIFEKVYKENGFLRPKVRSTLKHLIRNSIANHSEATLVNLLHFSEMLAEQYDDYFALDCLWQACMLSEWFSDHQIALGLLDKYEGLCSIIVNKIPFIVKVSLKQNRTGVVHTLIEVLLRFKMEAELCQVMLSLIDYWIRMGDYRQCKEVASWSVRNDVKLPAVYKNKKLMKLLTGDIKQTEDIFETKATKPIPKDFTF